MHPYAQAPSTLPKKKWTRAQPCDQPLNSTMYSVGVRDRACTRPRQPRRRHHIRHQRTPRASKTPTPTRATITVAISMSYIIIVITVATISTFQPTIMINIAIVTILTIITTGTTAIAIHLTANTSLIITFRLESPPRS